jgi:hypothetical protein
VPKRLRIIDIDVECKPGHWIGGDFVSKILTAVAWKWLDDPGSPTSQVEVLTHYEHSPSEMAEAIAEVITEADIVAGHYIRGFDLPLVNGNLLRAGSLPLDPVLAHDTKLDLTKAHGRSLSQKNLAAAIGVEAPKVDVNLTEWEAFNSVEPWAKSRGIERVAGDVIQNIEMRDRLLDIGWLGRPRVWDGTPVRTARYHA